MENAQLEELLRRGLRAMELPEDSAVSMARFADFLLERNQVMNLTAITEATDVAALHFLDSAALLKAADFTEQKVIDVGSGAGFPGIPLKLAEPTLRLTLLDAQRKRVDFLREAVSLLDISNVDCIHGRAEEFGRRAGPHTARGGWDRKSGEENVNRGGRERYGIAVSRAVASLQVLAELCLPLVRVGGLFLAMKSVNCDSELAEAVHALPALGGKMERLYDYDIPGTNVRHRAVVIRKEHPTPEIYPRPYARIKKRPLG